MSNNIDDDELSFLLGRTFESSIVPDVEYRIAHQVGFGAMAVAFYAMRAAPEGFCPVVIKMLRPSFVRQHGEAAALSVQKEAVALGRLNERVPSTPFVVRLIDTGTLTISDQLGPICLPWMAIEYVHGGPLGTTLTQRVHQAIQDTTYAFNTQRAANAIACLCSGLSAVHSVGVIHRDIKPSNVLCCGSGEQEVFKVADFGISRQEGAVNTFFGDVVGTLGYVAPEAFGQRGSECGPWTDIYGLAGIVFFLLTGRKYLDIDDTSDMVSIMASTNRPRLLDSPKLCPQLRRHEAACRAIDKILASATAWNRKERPANAEEFSSAISPWLQPEEEAFLINPSPRARDHLLSSVRTTLPDDSSWTWIVRQRASSYMVVRRAAWDTDGRCLAATNIGMVFWTGTQWYPVPRSAAPEDETRLVHRVGPSTWLVAFGDATLAKYSARGFFNTTDLSNTVRHLDAFDGEPGDLVVMVDRTDSEKPLLRAMSGWRWLKPMPIDGVASIASMARFSDTQWLFVGRGEDKAGLVGVYTPLDFDVQLLSTPTVRAFVACAGCDTIDTGLAAGAEGAIVWRHGPLTSIETVEGGHDVSAVAIDLDGEGWAAGAGRIWLRHPIARLGADRVTWKLVWEDDAWTVPFVSLYSDAGLVIAMTADGAILEGWRNGWNTT